MICEICKMISCHNRCPNHIPPKSKCYCSICKDGILDGEEYVENDKGEYAHYFCMDTVRDAIEWLGYKTKIMEGSDERNY